MTIPHKPFGELSDAEKGALLLAHHEGKRIEVFDHLDGWERCTNPVFLADFIYRIAPEPKVPDSINWEHVAPEYNFMARDEDGIVYIYELSPVQKNAGYWPVGQYCPARGFASYRRGTVDWKDSLVIRPGYEGKP